MPGLVARFSKYDCWNLWKILDRNRSNKKLIDFCREKNRPKKFFGRKFFLIEKIFGRKNFGRNFFDRKKNFDRFFFSAKKKSAKKNFDAKNQNFKIFKKNLKNLTFSKKMQTQYFFSMKKKSEKKNRKHISIQKIPKIPKITLRKSCDEAWYTSSGEEEKTDKFASGFVPHQPEPHRAAHI